MVRFITALLPVLLALSCQQGTSERPVQTSPVAGWQATEAQLEAEAAAMASQLEPLSRQEGNDAALEAYAALQRVRTELHKAVVTATEELNRANTLDATSAEQMRAAASARAESAFATARKRVALARAALPAPAAAPVEEKKDSP